MIRLLKLIHSLRICSFLSWKTVFLVLFLIFREHFFIQNLILSKDFLKIRQTILHVIRSSWSKKSKMFSPMRRSPELVKNCSIMLPSFEQDSKIFSKTKYSIKVVGKCNVCTWNRKKNINKVIEKLNCEFFQSFHSSNKNSKHHNFSIENNDFYIWMSSNEKKGCWNYTHREDIFFALVHSVLKFLPGCPSLIIILQVHGGMN